MGPGGEFSRRAPKLYQPACKPGSVWRAWLDARVTAIPLRRRLPGAFSNLPGRRDPDIDPRDCSLLAQRVAPVPSLFGLAPGGVCPAACVAAGAVRSYRTFSPLPLGRSSAYAGCRGGGLFSVALSLGSRPPDVIRHRMSMEPGLSSRTCLSALVQAAVQPTDHIGMGCERPAVKVRSQSFTKCGRAGGLQLVGGAVSRASYAATSAFRVARVETSTMPSTRCGRKWR